MAEKIDLSGNAVINNIKLAQQTTHPSSPASGYEALYIMSGTAHGGLFVKDSSGREIGPFITGTASGGGAPTTSKYVLTAVDAGLPNAVVIPGFAGSADREGISGGSLSREFDSGGDPLTWSPSAPDTHDITTINSHLYIKSIDGTARYGLETWAPTGTFDARMKITWGAESNISSAPEFWFLIENSDASKSLLWDVYNASNGVAFYAQGYHATTRSSFTTHGAICVLYGTNELYFRITRDGSGDIHWYWSTNGILWSWVGTVANATFNLVVDKIGIGIRQSNAICYYAIDWIRGTG